MNAAPAQLPERRPEQDLYSNRLGTVVADNSHHLLQEGEIVPEQPKEDRSEELQSHDNMASDLFVTSRVFNRRNNTHTAQNQRRSDHHTGGPQSGTSYQPKGSAGNTEDRVIFGTGLASGVKASQVDSKSNTQKQPGPNRTVTGVFVTRLNPRTTTRQLEAHVQKSTGQTVTAEKLLTRYETYSSFYIRADRRMRDTLLDASVWPKGCLIKQFFE
jgi:hypothetical protein